jgi:predicted ArsR family transcriptional regulator
LLSEGAIELVPRDLSQPAPRGRPEQFYRLASRSLPNNFPSLCAALLDALLCPLPFEAREPALRSLAGRLAGSFVSVASLTPRLNQAAAFLSQHGYRARWEAHASGPRILLRSCPYAEILPSHPELCLVDRFLLERLVQFPLTQIAQINPAGGKPAACIFASALDS